MQIAKYQSQAKTTILPNCHSEEYMILGIGNESGELQGKFKKRLRGDEAYQDDEKFKDMVVGEIGDILWYLAGLCTTMGIELNEVAELNIEKLLKRQEENKLMGDGDTR